MISVGCKTEAEPKQDISEAVEGFGSLAGEWDTVCMQGVN